MFGHTGLNRWARTGHTFVPRTHSPSAVPVHPVFRRLPPPVIVIGMHGSGTSVVSGILAELGVYMGSHLDHHGEATEFFDLNEELLFRAGATWNRPEAFAAKSAEPGFCLAAEVRLAGATHGRLRTRYLAGKETGSHMWGWKDPRNSLSLPLWLRVFPHARIIHVARRPEDAALSIHRRAVREAGATISSTASRDWTNVASRVLLYPPAGGRYLARRLGVIPQFPGDDPCLDFEHCQALTQLHLDACYRFRDLGGPRLEVRYEELLRRPREIVDAIAAFTLGDVPAERIAGAAGLVRSTGRAPALA